MTKSEIHGTARALASKYAQFALLVLVLWQGASICSASAPEIEIEFRPVMSSFPLGGPVLVEVTFTNRGDESKELDLGANRKEAYEFEMVGPTGESSTTRWRHEGGVFDPGDFELAPGARYNHVLVLNDWYSFDKAGVYKVTARIEPLAEKVRDSELLVEEFAIKVEEDQESLVALCSELAKRAMATNLEKSALAASALSYVEDPSCITFMEHALEEGRPLAGILEGLGRIATPRAVDILERYLRSSDLSSHRGAARGLRKVAERTEDEELRQRVETLLEEVQAPEITIEPPPGEDERRDG